MLPSVCPGVCITFAVQRAGFHRILLVETVIDLNLSRRLHPDPIRLQIKHLQKRVIVVIKQDRRTCGRTQLHRPADVVDVGVRDHDLLHLEFVLFE